MRRLIEAIPEAGWTSIEYWLAGGADVAETTYTPFKGEQDAASVRLIVRRVKPTPGSQLALFTRYSYHAFITDRAGQTLELEADHRRHAEIENAIRDLKYGVGLNHLPSGRFAANGAWLAVQVIAHNLARWTARIGLAEGIVTTKTLRRRLFALAGRLTRSARQLTLHLPARWPWAVNFTAALARAAGEGAPDLTPLGLADRSTAWRQHACERLPTAVSSCPHARTATVAPCQRHQPLPHPPNDRFALYSPRNPDRRWIRVNGNDRRSRPLPRTEPTELLAPFDAQGVCQLLSPRPSVLGPGGTGREDRARRMGVWGMIISTGVSSLAKLRCRQAAAGSA